jgi:molybdate transport system substrate-binding protein
MGPFRCLLLGFAVITAGLPGCSRHADKNKKEILTVASAISLREAINRIEPVFEERFPDIDLVPHYASSGALRFQIENGAPLQVYISAHEKHIQALIAGGHIHPESTFPLARNRLVLAFSRSGQKQLGTLTNPLNPESASLLLKDPGFQRIALGEPEAVPVGTYSRQVLRFYNLEEALENRLVLAKDALQIATYLQNDLVHAGFLYQTDVSRLSDETVTVLWDQESHSLIQYLAAPVSPYADAEPVREFIQFLSGQEARAIFEELGFQITGDLQ